MLVRKALSVWRRLVGAGAPAPRADVGALIARWWPELSAGECVDPILPWATVVEELRSRNLLQAAALMALDRGAVEVAMALVERALGYQHDLATLRVGCRVAYEAARLESAAAYADALEATQDPLGAGERRLVDAIRERRRALACLDEAPADIPPFEPRARSAINVLAYSMPYTSNGYATRSHGLLCGLQGLGWEVNPVTRPGYPKDADASTCHRDLPDQDLIGGLMYRRLFESSRRRLGQMPYLLAAADEIGSLIERVRPQVIHAASNYMTALPACLAARRAGLPFVYEVRGFWDVTRASSDPSFDGTAEARYLRLFEAALLRRADAIVTLTSAMKAELVRRGAAVERIFVAPNAVDAERFAPLQRDDALAMHLGIPDGVPVIGYVGSLVDYEGLDDLVDACAILMERGRVFRLLVVGDGMVREALTERVATRGLESSAIFAGRVPHSEVASIYSLIDICPFPRKPWPVCELVSPLKPYEAMAMGKAVLVSDVAAMAEMIEPGVNGFTFAKGETVALANALGRLLDDPAAFRAMGQSARQWVKHHRTWRQSATVVTAAYEAAVTRRASASASAAKEPSKEHRG